MTIIEGVLLVDAQTFPFLPTVIVQRNGQCYANDGEWWYKTPRIYATQYGVSSERGYRMRRIPKGKVMALYQPGPIDPIQYRRLDNMKDEY